MSVDSTALERSALERKDRDELVTIAQALGGKPAARATKATIVNLILELTGVSPAPAAAPAAKATRSRKPAAAEAPADEAAPAAAPSADVVDAPEAGADAPEADEADDADEAEEDDLDGDADEQAPAPPRDRSPQQQGGNNGNNGQDGGYDGDDEPGNRRRRRRGRNRDRQGDPQGQGQGQSQGDDPPGDPIDIDGIVDLRDEGYGFLRVSGFLPSRDDAYISVKQARQLGLRRGDHLQGASRPALRNEKNPALLRIDAVNGADPDQSRDRPRFDDLTPVFPAERLTLELEQGTTDLTARIIDVIAPIGKGQRGLIASPPKAGKTTILKDVVRSIETNHPDVHLFVVLVDERPEEVTELRRWVQNDSSTVVASTFDRPAEEHVQVAELVLERAKRLVESGADVVIVLDGITRLARACNLAVPATGRTLPGGLDAAALYAPKRFLGAARNVEEGGSLTILATALVDTGSRTDEAIYEELGGTANLELRLDRHLAERRSYPAIDVARSSTSHEELLLGAQLEQVWALRRALQAAEDDGSGRTALEVLVEQVKASVTNHQLLAQAGKAVR